LKRGFSITVEHGDAIIHSLPSPNSRSQYAVGSGIGVDQISRFFLQQDLETRLTEVILELTFEPKERCLGVTENFIDAEEWVKEANILVSRHRHQV
jgi:hypothetical protein